MDNFYRCCFLCAFAFLTFGLPVCAQNVTTHHYDNFRSGWDWQEATLTASNVNPTFFSLQAIAAVDAQVDAQPLVLTNQSINGTLHAIVVYVATENNSVYAIDGVSGSILAQVTLEAPMPISSVPGGSCTNNSSTIGINSTPVIDPAAGVLYVVTATPGSGTITYHLHALSTSTLANTVSPMTLASPSGVTYNRQRSALTLFNGGVLVPFTSFCDNLSSTSLGYIVYANLSGSASGQTSFQTSLYNLSTIWMSGSGPAVNGNDIYFTTGNQKAGNSVSGPPGTNLPDSLIRLTGSTGVPLTLSLTGSVTPDTTILGPDNDQDFGAGGVLIIPSGAPSSITASTPAQYVTGLGKQGVLYLNSLGLGAAYLQSLSVGGDCHCGTSYFTGEDHTGHVVTSAGTTLGLYTLSSGGLTLAASTGLPAKGPDPGVFTTISSNGTSSPGVIWTVSGPDSSSNLTLLAFSANNLASLYTATAGYWPNANAMPNTVPVVANGHVYVASNGELSIWGAAAGALPATPTNLGTDGAVDCPLMKVSWNPSAGASSYQLFVEQSAQWIPANRRLKYSGSSSTVDVTATKNIVLSYTVAACNQFGCSNPSTPAIGEVNAPCP